MTGVDVGFSLFFGAFIALLFLLRWWYERKIALHGYPDPEAFSLYQGILAQYSTRFFLMFILAFVAGKAVYAGWNTAADLLLEISLQLLVLLTVYFGVLLVLLPLLRRRISALSCDELVVYGAEDHTRREYASLLLETAGDQRGLSTCLSASANSLRQRLRGVITPGKRTSGAVVLGLTMALLMLCFGMVTVGMAGSGRDLVLALYGAEQAVGATLVEDEQDLRQESLDGDRAQALEAYLSQLPLTRLSASRAYYPKVDGSEQRFYLTLLCSDGSQLEVRWDDQFCVVRRENRDLALFRMDGPVNWDYLRTLAA